MIKYSQTLVQRRRIFEKQIFDSNKKLISCKKVFYPIHYVKRDDKTYILLYDDAGNIIHEVFKYLNMFKHSSINSKLKAVNALRLLYCFLDLRCYDIHNIDETIFNELKIFLLGIGEEETMTRNVETVNSFFSVYRDYFEFCDIKCPPLWRTQTTIDFENKAVTPRYKNNLKVNDIKSDEVPKYISKEECKTFINYFLNKKDIQSAIIVSLMWMYGLRLGEVLGLTYEDVCEETTGDSIKTYIIIRNRVSDKKFQFAKNHLHPINKQIYSSKLYQNSCDKVLIDVSVYEWIWDFIDKNHLYFSKKYPANFKTTIADNTRLSDTKNRYLFINKYGKILSDQTWNNHLKKAFIKLGIPIDKNHKKLNLSHRFRHGFAMHNAHFSEKKLNALELQKIMRHKSINSTSIYFNLDNKDKKMINDDFVKFLKEKLGEM